MTRAVLDDHLLRDVLVGDVSPALADLLHEHEPATTNLFLHRLSRSVVVAAGGSLTGAWTSEQRRALGAQLLTLPDGIAVVPMTTIAFRMAEVVDAFRVSTLGAECVAAAEHLDAPLCVWSGDDGPRIRVAMDDLGLDYRTISR